MNNIEQDCIDDEMVCTACDEDCDELYSFVPDDRKDSIWYCVECYAKEVSGDK